MAQNEMTRLVPVFSLILTVPISGVAAEVKPSVKEVCAALCAIKCLPKRSPTCIANCLKKCRSPLPALDGVSKCAFSCANSNCINFISDSNKLEGCAGSCYKNCSHDP